MAFLDIPGYMVLSEIGRGGMGVVYRARHISLERTVALKVLHPQLANDEEFVRNFAREAKTVAKLFHHNIVHIYDFGFRDGVYYLSMQFVQGKSLRDLLAARKPTVDECIPIIKQIADALDYAHREEVVHRDLKPGNVLLGPGNKAMIIDFGVAHGSYVEAANQAERATGTPSYMSPEQCRGSKASPRSDQYALGVIVYEMVAGKLPFTETDPTKVMQQHLHENPPPLRTGRTDITPRMEAAVMRALSKVPELRFPTLTAFADEFEAACLEARAAATPMLATAGAGLASGQAAGQSGGSWAPASLLDGSPAPSAPRSGYQNTYTPVMRPASGSGARAILPWLIAAVIAVALAVAAYSAFRPGPAATTAPGKSKTRQSRSSAGRERTAKGHSVDGGGNGAG